MSVSTNKKIKEYYSNVEYLESLENLYRNTNYWDGDLSAIFLERMKYFLNLLELDLDRLKVIHITGTAGKGTVAHTIHNALTQSGKKSGLFTSPFTVSTLEYFKIGKNFITVTEFNKIVSNLKSKIDFAYANSPYGGPSYFEIITCIALIYFLQKDCEYAVIEVGLGGRYDSTNVFNKKELSVITNVGMDHVEILGSKLEDIADNKAGIIKGSKILFSSVGEDNIRKILLKECKKYNAKAVFTSQENLIEEIAKFLSIPKKYYVKAVNSLEIPCRFETISSDPKVILDGAHNNLKFDFLVNQLEKIQNLKLSIIFAINSRKDYKYFFNKILKFNPTIYLTRFNKAYTSAIKSTDPSEVQKYLNEIGYPSQIFMDNNDAYRYAVRNAEKNELILVTGSFFLCKEVRNIVYPEINFLKKNI